MFMLPELKPEEILIYLRKSRTDDPALSVQETVAKGDLSPVTAWLTDKIHVYGKLYEPKDLLPAAMGGPLDAKVYTDYLKKKFGELYKL